MGITKLEQIIHLVHEKGMIRPRDLEARGIPRMYLQRLYERGQLQRSGRGVYILAGAEQGQDFSLVEACKRVPHGVLCLLSALRFHNLGTQSPHQVWMAIHPKKHRPQIDYPPLRIVRFSGPALSEGVEEHRTSDGLLRVYGVAKTVADCFRYRNKVGLDVALEALHECRRERRATPDELWHYATVDRVSTVMRPYMEYGSSRMKQGHPRSMAASVKGRLLQIARTQGEELQSVLTRYAIERFLYRLSLSEHRQRFILKGATVFTLWLGAAHRPTRDVDFLG